MKLKSLVDERSPGGLTWSELRDLAYRRPLEEGAQKANGHRARDRRNEDLEVVADVVVERGDLYREQDAADGGREGAGQSHGHRRREHLVMKQQCFTKSTNQKVKIEDQRSST